MTLDRNNAIYISKGETKNLTKSETYAYFSDEYWSPFAVPQKYWDMAGNYLNQTITTRTYGICQDVAYTCRPGQIRRDCDPCAALSARDWAQSIHVVDMIRENCGNHTSADASESNGATTE